MFLLLLVSITGICLAEFETCERDYTKIGCFQRNSELFPDMIANNRDAGSSAFTGNILVWKKYESSLHDLACKCARKASRQGYEMFAIGFYGECHGGKSTADFVQFSKNGGSNNCVANNLTLHCDNNGETECAGGEFAEYVYHLKQKAPEPIHGNFTEWSEFTPCSASCGPGIKERERQCTNPIPKNGGEDCKGESSDIQECQIIECPVHGNWSEWGDYSECSASCGGGVQSRSRSCTNPAPAHGGEDCVGQSIQEQQCNKQPCPVDGVPQPWSSWGSCSATCGGGSKTQRRTCKGPFHGGKPCSEEMTKTASCGTDICLTKDDLTNRIKDVMSSHESQSNDDFRYTLQKSLSSTYPSYYFTVSSYKEVSGWDVHAVRGYTYVAVFRQHNRNVVVTYTKKSSNFPSSAKQSEIGREVVNAIKEKGKSALTSLNLAWDKAKSFGYPVASVHVVRFGSGLRTKLGSNAVFKNFLAENDCGFFSCDKHESSLVIVFGSA